MITSRSYYGRSATSESIAKSLEIHTPSQNITLYFSYETLIAFTKDSKLFIRQNDWGTTTGKHLNSINRDKSIRLATDEFWEMVEQELGTKRITCSSYYGNSPSSSNNATYYILGNKTLYFSYETLVAVSNDNSLKIRENVWGPTSGKHLNNINSDKQVRSTERDFEDYIKSLEIAELFTK